MDLTYLPGIVLIAIALAIFGAAMFAAGYMKGYVVGATETEQRLEFRMEPTTPRPPEHYPRENEL